MKKRKRPLTLLEVMIALALTAILLGFLFDFYRQTTVSNASIAKARQKILCREVLHQRLNQLFAKVGSLEENKNNFFIDSFSESYQPALFLKYDNGMDRDPLFCGEVLSVLYLDKKKMLSLVTWPDSGSPRKEILLEGIDSLRFDLFDFKLKQWIQAWPKKAKELPALFKVILQPVKSNDPLEYAFDLSTHSHPITYTEGKKGT